MPVYVTSYNSQVRLYTFLDHQRSEKWLSEEALFTSGAAVCPLNAKVITVMQQLAMATVMYM